MKKIRDLLKGTRTTVSLPPISEWKGQDNDDDKLQNVLPQDILKYILTFLDPIDIARYSSTSVYHLQISRSENLWKSLYLRDYGIEETEIVKFEDWRRAYINSYEFRFVASGKNITILPDRKTAMGSSQNQTVVTNYWAQQDKSYSFRFKVLKIGYIGFGICNQAIDSWLDAERLHSTPNCFVYYYTGVWYGSNNQKDQNHVNSCLGFGQNDEITIEFDPSKASVQVFNNDQHVLTAGLFAPRDFKKEKFRIGCILGSDTKIQLLSHKITR